MKEERFSSGTLSKNKMSNFGAISPLYPNFIYHPLSLNLKKNKSQEKTFVSVDCPFIICLTLWKCTSLYSKGLMYFYVTPWSKFVLCSSSTNLFLHASFSASIRLILLRIVLLIPLKYRRGNRSCRLLQYNIITTKTYRLMSSVV